MTDKFPCKGAAYATERDAYVARMLQNVEMAAALYAIPQPAGLWRCIEGHFHIDEFDVLAGQDMNQTTKEAT